MMSSILHPAAPAGSTGKPRNKITVVGVGAVGMAAAFSMMTRQIVNELCLVDVAADKTLGEVMDMQQGQQLLENGCHVKGGSDYAVSANSDIVVITAGARQEIGESRLNLIQRNVEIYKKIIPEVVKHSPNCIIVVVSNPVDLLTYVAWKISNFPRHRIIGTGTLLDSARFRYFLGKKLGVSPRSIHGYVIGEHGDSSVPVWSKVSVGGVQLSTVNPAIGTDKDPENFKSIHQEVVQSAYDIIKNKGYTSWAIGLCCYSLCNAILNNLNSILPVTAPVKGLHGIQHDVFTSVPCVINSGGISHIVGQQLSEVEATALQKSANTLHEIASGIKW